MENDYIITVNTHLESRIITAKNVNLDEAISFGIVMFDKYATHIGDFCMVSVCGKHSYIPKRRISLTQGLKVNIQVF